MAILKNMPTFSRRTLLISSAGLLASAAFSGPWVYNRLLSPPKDRPILIGITSDADGHFSECSGMDRRGIVMAVTEFNNKGGLLGREIQLVRYNLKNNATDSDIVNNVLSQTRVDFLIGAVNSDVANRISHIAQKYRIIFFNTNAPSPITNYRQDATFNWATDPLDLTAATMQNAIKTKQKNWVMLTSDDIGQRKLANAIRKEASLVGISLVSELFIPMGCQDFSPFLRKIKEMDPDIIALAVHEDDLSVLYSQVLDLGMDREMYWHTLAKNWPDIYRQPMFGMFGTNWYHKFANPGVDDFVKKYQNMYPDVRIRVPGNVFYNAYMATKTLLSSIENTGTTNTIKLIKQLEGQVIPARVRMQDHDAWIDPTTHQCRQSIGIVTANTAPSTKNDTLNIIATVSPTEIKKHCCHQSVF
jgi:branched-chain amino acid transport system substrate-binding protein